MNSPLLVGVIDGLLLGAARLVDGELVLRRPHEHVAWVRQVADALRRGGLEVKLTTGRRVELRARGAALAGQAVRWRAVPRDVVLSAETLAHWFAGAGVRGSEGYSVRLRVRGTAEDRTFLANRLAGQFNWAPTVTPSGLRLSRSGDRMALRRLVVGLLPPCFGPRLNLRESAPCTPGEAQRRRSPRRLGAEAAAAIRRRAAAGEPYAAIATDFRVGRRTVGKVARGELHGQEEVLRRRARVRRLTPGEARHVLELAQKGLSQRAIATELGIGQPRVSRLVRGVSITV